MSSLLLYGNPSCDTVCLKQGRQIRPKRLQTRYVQMSLIQSWTVPFLSLYYSAWWGSNTLWGACVLDKYMDSWWVNKLSGGLCSLEPLPGSNRQQDRADEDPHAILQKISDEARDCLRAKDRPGCECHLGSHDIPHASPKPSPEGLR